ncbi:TetR family transcriptional regulator [Nocardioides marmoriginsengisoli]|uniref:TetR family transcriptional regulator n=1 Tax=Nocardioides marmoriginsengisoli TaxID=661483 RepID=A0A3N0CPC4_9ACTN|nr:TetR/AcrR family transcriptional regulator [Nocardioides marmoriginsengisoli]RNL65322.1 TetR family transcriptional regulator [Nocardioides marmoriginsengisoli]
MTTVSAAPDLGPARGAAGTRRSAPRRTQVERRAESERRLLRAAAELLVERGIEGTSLAEIGRRAGYSHGLVHQRFGSKDAMIARLTDEAARLFTTTMVERIGNATGALAVRVLAETYLSLVQGPDPVARVHLLVWSEAIANGSGEHRTRPSWDRVFRSSLATMIKDGIARGSVRADVDPVPAAVVIVGLLRGVALQQILDPAAGSIAGARTVALDHLDRMLRPTVLNPRPDAPVGR